MRQILILATSLLFTFAISNVFAKTLKLGHGHTSTHSFQLSMIEANKKLKKLTNGGLKLKLYPSAQLGNERQMQEQVSVGTLEMAISGVAGLLDPAFSLFEFPFLYDNREQIYNVMYSDVMDELNKKVQKRGVRILGFTAVGFRDVTSNKPMDSIAAYKGFKIRTPESAGQIATFEALGASPTPMSFSELYSALQQGVVDGQENPPEIINDAKFFEVQKYVNVTEHIYNWAYVIISESVYQSLSEKEQKILSKTMKFATRWSLDNDKKNAGKFEKLLKKQGMEFVYPDREALRKATFSAYKSSFIRKMGPRGERIIKRIREIVTETK